MPITYSLQNLLLDDPPLDHMYDLDDGLLGPIVRMRWISNLVRLAVLEEADQFRAAAGEYTEHDAEIRRLRRASMAPDAGRYYPVEGKANQVFKRLDPEQARQIVEHWRARQPRGAGRDPVEAPACPERSRRELVERERSPRESYDDDPDDVNQGDAESDLSDEYSEVAYGDEECHDDEGPFSGEPGESESEWSKSIPIPHSHFPIPSNPLIESGTKHQTSHTKYQSSFPIPLAAPAATLNTKHQTRNTKPKTRPSRVTRFAGAAAVAAIMLLAALLGVAATWFLKSRIQTTAPQPAPAGIHSTTKMVPSAVPRRSSESGMGMLGIWNPHPTPHLRLVFD
jgi:hypothetical protein